jgi:2'-5' RNA ligase
MSTHLSQRFFIALIPPPAIQTEVNKIKQDFADRYASRAAFKSPPHITLQAPFTWPLERLPELTQPLAEFAAQHSALPIRLDGFAAFPPRVIFIDVERSPALLALQQDLATCMTNQCGIVDERSRGRAFAPHMTVAFRDLTRQNFRLAWPEFEGRSWVADFVATHLTLLIHTGQQWIIQQEFLFAQS